MKRIALALTLLAFTGSFASDGSILVNTVSFADLPDKTETSPGKDKSIKNNKATTSSTCTVKVNACSRQVKNTSLAGTSCAAKKASIAAAKPKTTPVVAVK